MGWRTTSLAPASKARAISPGRSIQVVITMAALRAGGQVEDRVAERDSVPARELHVDQHEVRAQGRQLGERGGRLARLRDHEVRGPQRLRRRAARNRVGIDHERTRAALGLHPYSYRLLGLPGMDRPAGTASE